jgi:hypothetical protein
MLSLVKRHPIITFFVLTYAIGWGCIRFWTFQAGSPFIAALIVISLKMVRSDWTPWSIGSNFNIDLGAVR